MMENLDFSVEEIQEQLDILGYKNVPKHRLLEFKQDLDELMNRDEVMSLVPPPHSKTSFQRNPPAYIKENVGLNERFFPHSAKDRDRWANTADSRHAQTDSYAQHSVAQSLQIPPGAPKRLQVEPHMQGDLLTVCSSHSSSPDSQERPITKRKVLRKHNGQLHVCDESFYSENSDASSSLEHRLSNLQLSPPAPEDNGHAELLSQTQNSDSDVITLSAFEAYMTGGTRSLSQCSLRPKPKSFIRPNVNQRVLKKTDPVARYFHYKQLWDTLKCPGEADRRALRWEIKERLAYQLPPPEPPKPLWPTLTLLQQRRNSRR